MFQFSVAHVGTYHYPQHWRAPCNVTGIVLMVKGLRKLSLAGVEYPPGPMLCLFMEGMELEFDFDKSRENWVVILDGTGCAVSENPRLMDWPAGDGPVNLPMAMPVSKLHVGKWRTHLQRMQSVLASPTPRNRMLVRIMAVEMLRFLMEQSAAVAVRSPAMELKQCIDDDTRFEFTLQKLCADCGYSTDHLRLLFNQEYGISPHAYRSDRRMAFATSYITGSNLRVKEIARLLGFEFVSAFTAFYKNHAGLSPREAIKRYRGGGGYRTE